MKAVWKVSLWPALFAVICAAIYFGREVQQPSPEAPISVMMPQEPWPDIFIPGPLQARPTYRINDQGEPMTATGPSYPGTGANDASYGAEFWANPGNVTADDTSYAVSTSMGGTSSQYLKATNFGFSLASDQVIDGIEIVCNRDSSSGVAIDDRVRIVKGGTVGSTELGAGATWPSGAFTSATFGGPTNLCGETWTYSDINASNFGVVFAASSTGFTTSYVDYIQITVYHHTSITDAFLPFRDVHSRNQRDSMWFFKQSTASQEFPLGQFVDDTDGVTPETALTIANTDIKFEKAGGTTFTSKNSGGATHIADGNYYAVADATDTDTIGSGRIKVLVAGALQVQMDYVVLHANLYDWLFGSSAPGTGAALDAAGVRSAVGLASANLDTQLSTIDDFLDTEIAAIKAKTDNLPSDPADASDIATSFTTVNTKLDTIDDFLDTEIAAIKAKTDQFVFTVANRVDATATLSAAESDILPNGSGTATAGAATTITLQTALGADTRVVGCRIKLTSGTGSGQCRTATAYVNSTQVLTVNRPWTTNPDNTTVYAIVYDDSAFETVCRVGSAFTSSAGTEVRCSAWLERNGQIITTYAASAFCTFTFREQGAGSDLFSVTDSAVNAQGIFEATQASPGFTSDRLYIASAAITEGGNVFTSRHPVSVR